MAYLLLKTIKGHKYYYVAQSARVNGKTRIINQVYLGTLENMIKARQQTQDGGPSPDYGKSFEFGCVISLLELADRLGVRKIIDDHVGKRGQGIPVGDSILLAAINRVVGQVSKNTFHEDWFKNTVLPNSFPKANEKSLSSQGFWNNMSLIDRDIIQKIEDDITLKIIQNYNIESNILLFDNTNFATYIDTENSAQLPKRGKSKEHRSDLKIVGLSLMVSPDNNIPLFHEPFTTCNACHAPVQSFEGIADVGRYGLRMGQKDDRSSSEDEEVETT
jgi:hypothetical protein